MSDHVCDFPTQIRLAQVGSLTTILDLHDPESGLDIAAEVVEPNPTVRQGRLKVARAIGSFPVGARLPDDGTLIVLVNVFGATYAAQATNYQAMFAALTANDEFIVETVLSGVTTRWFCDAPVDILGQPITSETRVLNSREYELRFLVQPNPTVTIGA